MARPLINIKARQTFSPRAVTRRVDRAAERKLGQAGGAVRLTARRSIRQSRNISKPGSPPRSHTRRLKGSIFYALASDRRSVLIGPVSGARRYGGRTVPQILEFGGRVNFGRERTIFIKGDSEGRLAKSDRQEITLPPVSDYEPRPFMEPALKKNDERFPSLFANSVTA